MTSRERVVFGSLVVAGVLGLRLLASAVVGLHADARARENLVSPMESLALVDGALARLDVAAADRAWRDAHGVVVRAASWQDYVELGDAALRIAERSDQPDLHRARARHAYFAALMRARGEGSVAGVTRVWRAFVTLGDREVAEQCALIAEKLQERRAAVVPRDAR